MIDKNIKKIINITLLLLFPIFLSAENNLEEFVTGKAYDWHDLSREKRAYGVDSKIVYKIDVKNISELKDERPYLLSNVIKDHLKKYKDIQKSDITEYLNSDKQFILYDYQPTIEQKTYKKIKINDKIVGETSFCVHSENLKVDSIFVYHIYFIDNNEIYQFWMNYKCNESEKMELANIKNIFSYENNTLYWKNSNSRYEFFRLLNHNNKMIPTGLLFFQEIYDNICSNLKIDGINIMIY